MTNRTRNLVIEWVFWCTLVAVLWMQTGRFSEEVIQYRYGAGGWPKAVLIGLLIGATGQLALGLMGRSTDDEAQKQSTKTGISRWQQAAIFLLPLGYLWLMHRTGFIVATPIFILVYLRVLEVTSWRYLLGVTGVITVLMLAIFVRLFYVALPVGAWPLFYEINNAIIGFILRGAG